MCSSQSAGHQSATPQLITACSFRTARTQSLQKTASSAAAVPTLTSKITYMFLSLLLQFLNRRRQELTFVLRAITRLDCTPVKGKSSCPAVPPCNGGLKLGATTNASGCASQICTYSGYSDGPSLSIQTTLAGNQTAACQSKYSIICDNLEA